MMRLSLPLRVSVLSILAACGGSAFTTGGDGASGGDSGAAGSDGSAADSPAPVEAGDDGAPAQDGPGATGEGGVAEGSVIEAGTVEAGGGGEGGVTGSGVKCGSQTNLCSGVTPVCCVGTQTACAHQDCGCETQLECASDKDCKFPSTLCCIGVENATCGQHAVAACASACSNGQSHLCDPSAQTPQCLVGKVCSTDSSTLQGVGLPPGQVYGVCK